jgi:DNA-binding transcriptional regulator LsrR (DeoR family)
MNLRASRTRELDQAHTYTASIRAQGKTQEEVARVLGVHRRTVERWLDISNAQVRDAYIHDLRQRMKPLMAPV